MIDTVKCPICSRSFSRAIYDFYFIHCNFDGCGCVFEKKTGKLLGNDFEEFKKNRKQIETNFGWDSNEVL